MKNDASSTLKDSISPHLLNISDYAYREDNSNMLQSLFLGNIHRDIIDHPSVSSTLYFGESLSLAANAAAARERAALTPALSRVSKDSDTESASSKVDVAEKQATGKRARQSPFTSAKDQFEEEVGECFRMLLMN